MWLAVACTRRKQEANKKRHDSKCSANITGLPSVIQFILIWFIPESPRWLIDHGREAQAEKVLANFHGNGDINDPFIQFEVNEIKEAIRIEKLAKDNSTFKSLFTTRGNLRRLAVIIPIAFFSQWSGNGIVSYYLSKTLDGIGIRSTGQKNLINGILQVYNLATAYLGALVVDKAGRRVLFLTSTAGMCVSYMVWTVCAATYAKSYTEVDADGYPIGANTNAGNGVLAAIFFYCKSPMSAECGSGHLVKRGRIFGEPMSTS